MRGPSRETIEREFARSQQRSDERRFGRQVQMTPIWYVLGALVLVGWVLLGLAFIDVL